MRHPTTLHSSDITWPKVRVLLFSQDDSFRFLVRQTFRKLNVREVLSTSVAADATPFMGQGPDLALLDLDGDVAAALAFLERVRGADGAMPVLAVARSGERAGLDQALALGIDGVVPKVVSGHELTHRVADTLKNPQRMPAPAPPKAKPTTMVPPHPPAAAGGVISSGAAPGPPPADSESQRLELAALTARLGSAIGGGTYGGSAGATITGGTLAADDLAAGKRPAGGTLAADDLAAGKRPAGGTLAADDPAAGKRPAGGKLDAADIVPAKPKGGTLEALAAAAPAALKLTPKAKDEAARRADEAAKAKWQDLLAEQGHQRRTGTDVAGFDVTAFVAAHLEWLASKGAAGKRANLTGMDLAGADLARTVLANATFREADLSDACLAESRLDGADFRYAKLGAADLAGANLGVAQLRHADLRLANLEGTALRGADLSGAKLRGARLAGADFSGATLVGTDLCETDLSQIDTLGQAQIDKAILDMTTKLPPGLMRPRPKDES